MIAFRDGTAAQGVKKSVVASTSTRLINRLPHPASAAADPQDDLQDEAGSAAQAESEDEAEEECIVQEKTPDTNVKLNQPLRCGRYGQDLMSHNERQNSSNVKQTEADRVQGQKPKLGNGGKVDPALIASRQSTSAPPVVPVRAAPSRVTKPQAENVARQVVPAAGPVAEAPQQPNSVPADTAVTYGPAADHVTRAAARGPVAASVDDLLTGVISGAPAMLEAAPGASQAAPGAPAMTASMAGSAAAMAENVAALARNTAADRAAAKAALGQHYRQYRARKAAAEQRNAFGNNRPEGASTQAAPAAAAVPVNRGSDAGPSSQRRSADAVDYAQHRNQSHAAAAAHAVADTGDVPLRMKYSSSSSGSSMGGADSWQNTTTEAAMRQNIATTSLHTQQRHQQQQSQPLVPGSKHQKSAKKHSKTTGLVQGREQQPKQAQQERHKPAVISGQIGSSGDVGGGICQIPAAPWEPASQPVDPQDVQLLLYGGANSEAEEQVRKSNDKLDMLLQSTVKKTQQSAVGKENQVSEQGKLYACSHLPLCYEI